MRVWGRRSGCIQNAIRYETRIHDCVALARNGQKFLLPRSSWSHSNGNIITFCFDRHTFSAPCDELNCENTKDHESSSNFHLCLIISNPSTQPLHSFSYPFEIRLLIPPPSPHPRIYNRELRLVQTNTHNRSRIYYVCSFLYFLYVHLARWAKKSGNATHPTPAACVHSVRLLNWSVVRMYHLFPYKQEPECFCEGKIQSKDFKDKDLTTKEKFKFLPTLFINSENFIRKLKKKKINSIQSQSFLSFLSIFNPRRHSRQLAPASSQQFLAIAVESIQPG